MKHKVLVSVINNISTDQRVEKVCSTLHKNGYELSVLGTNLYGLPDLNRDYKTQRFSLLFQKNFLLFAEFNFKLFWKLLFQSDKNTILLANDLDSLLPNYLVSRIKNIPLVFDSHEIYSELPSVQGRFSQKIWRQLEKHLIPKIKYFYTVSNGYACFLKKQYGNLPKVITNVPNYYFEKNTIPYAKIIIYQGVLKEGRGLESLFNAMLLLPEYKLWIIGYGQYEEKLKKLIEKLNLNNVRLLGKKLPYELKKITKQASLGISLEENLGLSYYHALPNKIFDYIHSGIPIVGTYLPEIKSIINNYGIGEVILNHNPEEIAEKIKFVSEKGKAFYQENLESTAKEYCWENQETLLLEIFSSASNSVK